jgi:glycosyltransferase involved in cell wall biosynthesis/GT2 family glycosyltransferase
VVSEFPPPEGEWIPWHVERSFLENFNLCRSRLRGRRIRFAGIMLVPRPHHRTMRLMALLLAPWRVAAFNENFDHFFILRGPGAVAHHLLWRAREFWIFETNPGGRLYTFVWRLGHPHQFRRPVLYLAALAAGTLAARRKALPRATLAADLPSSPVDEGITVVIPSRTGRELLAGMLPRVLAQLDPEASEVIVVDHGSDDLTREFLRDRYPQIAVEYSDEPLSLPAAVNRGIVRARFSHLCLLHNDRLVQAGFFTALRAAFDRVPDLFCATAMVIAPQGQRPRETGKAAIAPRRRRLDFPLADEPALAGEDLSYVLYGSGASSLYSTAKLRALGGAGEVYQPFYGESLDLGYRAWQRGWPTVFVSGARVSEVHRSSTPSYHLEADRQRTIELNYLRFLGRAVATPSLFRKLWREAIWRLNVLSVWNADDTVEPPRMAVLAEARAVQSWVEPQRLAPGALPDNLILEIGSGDVAVFPGRPARGRPVVLIVSPYAPFPLSHGGAVRMFNLMRGAARDFDLVLVCFTDQWVSAPPELLRICAEVVQVRRVGTHRLPSSDRPDAVEEFDLPVFHAALLQTMRKWNPAIAQVEFTQMAPYVDDCKGARTILVEHDLTFDLYAQLMAQDGGYETTRQWKHWLRFEREVWKRYDRVIAMSEKDRAAVNGAEAVCLPNGVDLERFRPSEQAPEPARLLFIGSFAHLPNVLAVDFFLRESWPRLQPLAPKLHVIAGSRHKYHLERFRDQARLDLDQPGIEVEDFVSDVRPAYRRAEVVIAPLVASAGTNIKIVEAMAMGKAIVSTPAGVNGLDVTDGSDVWIAKTGEEMANAIAGLLRDKERRQKMQREARRTAERKYDWETIARAQNELYRELCDTGR